MSRKKTRKPRVMSEAYIFEIKEWQPNYILSVDRNKDRLGPYREHLSVELETECIYPQKLVGRSALFNLAGDRDFMMPPTYRRDPDWVPNCVGFLELPPSPTQSRIFSPIGSNILRRLAARRQDSVAYSHVRGQPFSDPRSRSCSGV